jgi:glucosamine--fructose-6-phosphate aminotransferase (isomerizing)
MNPKVVRTQSRAFMSEDGLPQPIEFLVASDASAIVEHTKQVLYLEADDLAHIAEGELHIHRLHRGEDGHQTASTRSLETLEIEIEDFHEGQVQPLYAKGDLRVARIRCQHDAWPCQL